MSYASGNTDISIPVCPIPGNAGIISTTLSHVLSGSAGISILLSHVPSGSMDIYLGVNMLLCHKQNDAS